MLIQFFDCQNQILTWLKSQVKERSIQINNTADLATIVFEAKDYQIVNQVEENTSAHYIDNLFVDNLKNLRSRQSQIPGRRSWTELCFEDAGNVILTLLTEGVVLECPAYLNEKQAAIEFKDKFFQWLGEPCTFLLSSQWEHKSSNEVDQTHLMQAAQCNIVFSAGLLNHIVIGVSENKIGLLWFIGYD